MNRVDVGGGTNLVSTSSFNSYTSSTNSRLTNIESTTASLNTSVTNLNSFTSSQLTINSGYNTFTQSQETKNTTLQNVTASLNTATASLFTSASLSLTTASFAGNTLTFRKGDGTTFGVVIPDVSGSGINTGSFATTGSNAFFGTNTFSGAVSFTGSAPSILSQSFSGSIITNLTDIYSDVAAVQQIVTLTSASYAALASGSLTNPNTLYIVSGSTSGSGGGTTIPAGTISSSAQITSLGFVSSSVTASSLITASFSGNTLTFTKGDASTFGIVLPDVSGSTINTGSFATTSSFNSYTASNDQKVNSLIARTGSYATTGSNTFIGDEQVVGIIQAADSNVGPQWIAPTVFQGVGTSAVAYDQFVNAGNYDALHIQSNLNAGTDFQDYNGVTLSTWLSIPTNTGSNPAPIMQRGLVVTGSVNITGQYLVNGVPISGSGGASINTGSFATTGSNTFIGNQIISGNVFVSGAVRAWSSANDFVYGTWDTDFLGGALNLTAGKEVSELQMGANEVTQIEMYAAGGNYDTFKVRVDSGSNGTQFQDYPDATQFETWMGVGTSTSGNFGAITLYRNTNIKGNTTITGSLTVSGSTTLQGTTTFIDRSGTNNGNVYLGSTALNSNTTGLGNVAIGQSTLQNNTTGNNNFALGTNALASNTTGNNNFAAGADAGRFASGSSNIFIGGQSGQYVTGSANTIIGSFQSTAGTILENNIILADGVGNKRAQYSGSAWSFQDEIRFNKGGNKPCDIVSVANGATVNNSLVTTNSIILLTTQNGVISSDEYPAVVSNKQNGSFEIHHNAGSNLNVAYLIINPTA